MVIHEAAVLVVHGLLSFLADVIHLVEVMTACESLTYWTTW